MSAAHPAYTRNSERTAAGNPAASGANGTTAGGGATASGGAEAGAAAGGAAVTAVTAAAARGGRRALRTVRYGRRCSCSELRRVAPAMGTSLLGLRDVHEEWRRFVGMRRGAAAGAADVALHFCSTDLSSCFDTIEQPRLYEALTMALTLHGGDCGASDTPPGAVAARRRPRRRR